MAATVFAAAAAMLVSCSSTVPTVQDPLAHAPTGVASIPDSLGPSSCAPPSHVRSVGSDKIEIQGVASGGGTLWALVNHAEPVPSGTDLRIVWRMNGAARLTATAVGADGKQVPATGIVLASGVSWTRPGDPWNSALRFPTPGCWRVSVQRGAAHGDIWLRVS